MGKIIGLTYDSKEAWPIQPGQTLDANAEFDPAATIDEIVSALESGGHQVKKIGGARELLAQISNLGVDIVFNVAEGLSGRNRESQVPILLEMHGIPYTGSDALTLGATLDKSVAKKIFVADEIPTAKFFIASEGDDLKELNTIGFPLFVKPCSEGTSKGISLLSRVEDYEGLRRQVDLISECYHQPSLVEQFIKGTEFTVVVLGNETPEAMPVVQYKINDKLELLDDFYTFDRVAAESVKYICPAEIPNNFAKKLQGLAVKVYKSVGCRDLGRVDFRVDEKGNPFVLEINPLPCLAKKDAFGRTANALGIPFEKLVLRVLNEGLRRVNMDRQEAGV
ncbi:MAG: ATP-grasp domain-containing protein [Candidatus Aceula meridiana]|nr:ATP-grasp domain-containing protein [Candidatus Aceula meridiana]